MTPNLLTLCLTFTFVGGCSNSAMIGTESSDKDQPGESEIEESASAESNEPAQFVQPGVISGAFLHCGWRGPGDNQQTAQVGCRVETETGRKIANELLAWQVQHKELGPVDLVSNKATTSSKINKTFDVDIKEARQLSLTVVNNSDGQKLAAFNLVNLPGLQDRGTLECIGQRYSHDCIEELSSRPVQDPLVGSSAVPFTSLNTTAVLLSKPKLYQRAALYEAGQYCNKSGMTQETIGSLNFKTERRTLQLKGTDKTCFRSFPTVSSGPYPFIIPSQSKDTAAIPYCYFIWYAQDNLNIPEVSPSPAIIGGLKYSYVMTVANPATGIDDPTTAQQEHRKFVAQLMATTQLKACSWR